jgi:Na+/H+-dicarboxylate symporter
MRQLMCTTVSQLRSAQLIPLYHYAHLMYPACLFLFLTYASLCKRQPPTIVIQLITHQDEQVSKHQEE